MKKPHLFLYAAVFALLFTGCPETADSGDPLPKLTIKNESSYDLSSVKWANRTFTSPNSADLLKSTSATQEVKQDESGYITFTRKDIGITCRTDAPISAGTEDLTFTFTDQTLVVEQGNLDNKKTLAQITFISQMEIEYGGLKVLRQDTVNLGEAAAGYTKQFDLVLKNTGVGKLLLKGSEPVKISGAEGVFSIVQPASSEIAPNSSLVFKIAVKPSQAAQTYTGTVTISTNDPSGDFSFVINAVGVAPKPIIEVFQETTEIPQNGTVSVGEVIITRSQRIDLYIKNSGQEVLNIQNTQILIAGENPEMFSLVNPPGANISPGAQSLLSILFTPTSVGEKRATITIPTNDSLRTNAVFFIQATGKREYPVLEIKNQDTGIANNGELDFGTVTLGNSKTLTFTLNNTGLVALHLTGNPAVVLSEDTPFTMVAQPVRTTVEPEDPVNFTVRFTPTAENQAEATISIACDTQNGYFMFKVKGTGHVNRPRIQVISGSQGIPSGSGSVSFGGVAPNGTKTLNFTIKNTGEMDLNLTGAPAVTITGVDAASFGVTQQPNVSIAPNGETVFSVRFAPAADKIYEAQVNIPSNTGSPFIFTLSGMVVTNIGPTLAWSGAWIKQDNNIYSSNAITSGITTWETLAITSTNGCKIRVVLTTSCYRDNYGYASRWDGAKSPTDYLLKVSGNQSETYTYTVPAGAHHIYFGYVRANTNSYGKENITAEAVVVQ